MSAEVFNLPIKLRKKEDLVREARDRSEIKALPVSDGAGWPMQVVRIEQENDKKGRPHCRVVYQAMQNLNGDFTAGEFARELFYILPHDAVGEAWQAVHVDRMSNLAWACGKECTNDLNSLVGQRVRLVVKYQDGSDQYTEVSDYKPAVADANADDSMPF